MKFFCVQNDTNKFCVENKAVRNERDGGLRDTDVDSFDAGCRLRARCRIRSLLSCAVDRTKQLAVRVTHNRRNVPVC